MVEAVINNPLWILVTIAVGGALVKGLFWLRDVHTAKESWARFTAETFPAFAKEIRGRIDQIIERIPPPKTLASASPLRLSPLGEKVAESLNAGDWASRVAPGLTAAVAGMEPFEIDRFSENYVETELGEQFEKRVAACAYDFGITRSAVLGALRVVLRDELIRIIEAR